MLETATETQEEQNETSPLNQAWFRYVLGQYPTGVTLITACPDEEQVGMVVGTFSSVSLDPPLVAFMPDLRSTSWPKIKAAGSFCANILTSHQQTVCQGFARKDPDRFSANSWSETPSGSPRLEGAAAWIDCEIVDVIRAGDHDIVIGRVQALGVGETGHLPLLFLRGGYGSFSIPSIQSPGAALTSHVKVADLARPEIERLAHDLKLEVLLSGVVEDSVVVLTAAGVDQSPGGSPSRVGVSFPLAAPLAPLHIAWADSGAQDRWLSAAKTILGTVDELTTGAELAAVREQGYSISVGEVAAAEFERSVHVGSDTAAPDLTGVLPHLLSRAASGPAKLEPGAEVTSLHAPVFDSSGKVAVTLTLNGFTGGEDHDRLVRCLEALLQTTARLTDMLGGRNPITP